MLRLSSRQASWRRPFHAAMKTRQGIGETLTNASGYGACSVENIPGYGENPLSNIWNNAASHGVIG